MARSGSNKTTLRDARRRCVAAEPRAFRVQEAARLLDVCPHTVRRWLWDGHLRGFRLGGVVRIIPDDVFDLLIKHSFQRSSRRRAAA